MVVVYDGVFVKAKNKGMPVPTRVVANRNIPQMNRKWLAEKTSARMRKTMLSPAMLYDGTKRRLYVAFFVKNEKKMPNNKGTIHK